MSRRDKTMDDWLTRALEESKNTVRPNIGTWSEVDAEVIRDLVYAVTSVGGALLFGMTADQGAMSVLVMHKDAKHRLYEADADTMTQLLGQWVNAFERSQNAQK